MTGDGDVYDAFQGIAEALSRISGEHFHWGHPKSRLGMSHKSPAGLQEFVVVGQKRLKE